MWKRYPGALRYFTATTDTTALLRTGSCFLTPKSGFENFDSARCLHWEPGQPRLLVQGDSLAANLARALQKRYADYAVMQATAALYSPGHSDRWPAYAASLDRFIDAQLLTPPPRIERAVLFALWQPDDLLPLTAYVDRLKALGVKVTVIGPSPQFYLSVPLILAYSEMTGIEMVSRFEKAERRQLDRQFAAQLASRVQYVSLFDILCADPDGKPAPCRVREGDDALFVDREHLTEAGSKALVGRFPAF